MLFNLLGHRFERLTVIDGPIRKGTILWWKCRCDCGGVKEVRSQSLRLGVTKSCGCIRRERGGHSFGTKKHGMYRSAEYRCWHSMISRCKPGSKDLYAERGIMVCARWRASFETFLKDVGPRPSPKHSLERKNNAGNYTPSNVVWATRKVQQRNTRQNVLLTIGGRTQCIAAWAEEAGMPWDRLYTRVKRGWSEDRLLVPSQR